MRFRKLGNSGLLVAEISLGSWLKYSGGVEAEQGRAMFDASINVFDTANAYGKGTAGTAWGAIFNRHPRDSYSLATKMWAPMSDTDEGLSGE
jgi:aryl-alcohol dehydrogenase-like predicted oxidoreductase